MAAVCFDTPLNLSPNHATSMGQPSSPETSPQASVPTTVGFLYDSSSNRTFRIPDVPATSTILNVKQWYSKHVAPQGDSRQLAVMHNNIPVEDYTQVWQLAQGQGQFAVVVSPVSSPRSSLNLYVDTPLQPGAPISLRLSSDSTILYAKQRLLELLDLPMSTASSPATTLMHHASPEALLNDHTLEQCGCLDGSHLSLTLPSNELSHVIQPSPPQPFPSPAAVAAQQQQQQEQQYRNIADIWQQAPTPSHQPCEQQQPAGGLLTFPSPSPSPNGAYGSHIFGDLLPSALLEDDEEETAMARAPRSRGNRGGNGGNNRRGARRSHSPPGSQDISKLSPDQLQHLAANFRTKLCRNGHSCKFGRHCWFAHMPDELRKPSDPLPNNLPAVHKLERYSHREGKDRQ